MTGNFHPLVSVSIGVGQEERWGLCRAQTLKKGIRPVFTVHYISFALISFAKFSHFFNEFFVGPRKREREIQVGIITKWYRVIIEIFSKLGHNWFEWVAQGLEESLTNYLPLCFNFEELSKFRNSINMYFRCLSINILDILLIPTLSI